jgi:2-iminobutanoate/2-iminopropanoate deaminase
LREAGSAPEHVLRVQCYLLHAEDFAAWNRVWAEYFPAPRPVRTTIVTGFTVPGMLIEVEVTAGIPS